MLTVLVLIVILLAVYGVAYRHTAAALRIETVRTQQANRDQGSMESLARGLALLETGLPPSSPYERGVTVNTPGGSRSFTLTFTNDTGQSWSVRCVPTPPGQTPAPMPVSFAP
jgi:hypothetical protein